ncbi:AAA domain-containing protein [Streptomyces sp. NPDC059718]
MKGTERAVRDCVKYSDVVWLADLPERMLSSGTAARTRLVTARHRPPLDPPPLPKVLHGKVPAAAAAVAGPHPPALGEPPVPAGEAFQPEPVRGAGRSEPGPAGTPDAEAGNASGGEVLRAVAQWPPEVVKAYEKWAERWRRWAQDELEAQPYRRQYQQLYRMAKKVQQDSDHYEVVLAVGLVQIGAERPSARVRRHLLTAPVALAVDADSVEVTVSLLSDESCRLEDTDFLSESDGYTSEFIASVRAQVEEVGFHPLDDPATAALQTWAQRAFGLDRSLPFDAGVEHPDLTEEAGAGWVHRAPALILRENSRRSAIGFYESIARHLKKPGARSPLGLAQLLYELEQPQRVAWGSGGRPVPPALGPEALFPMVANAAQRDVLDRLRRDTSVVVQGPPGTGKTHTISNLIAALLAEGKRVLVTSAKDQALEVLRNQLPPRMRDLCVLQRNPGQGGRSDVQRSLAALARLRATTDTAVLRQRMEDGERDRVSLQAEQAALRDQLRAVRETEWYVHGEVAPGYRGRLDDIVTAVEAAAGDYSWCPPLPDPGEPWPPVTTDEAERMVTLVARHGRQILESPAQSCPDPASVPAPQDVTSRLTRLRDAEQALTALGSPPEAEELAQHLAEASPDRLEGLEVLCVRAQQALQHVGLSADPGTWAERAWTSRALHDGLAQHRQTLWDSVRMASRRARETQGRIAAGAFPHVDIPALSDSQEREYLTAGRELEAHLRGGGTLGGRWLKPAVVKRARLLLEQCRVDGMPPQGAEQVAAVVSHLQLRSHARVLRERWQGVGEPPEADGIEQVVAELLDRAVTLEAVDACVEAIRQVHGALPALGADTPVTTFAQWGMVREAVGRARVLIQVRAAEAEVAETARVLPAPGPRTPGEVQHLADAVAARDAQAYREAVEALVVAYQREADRREAGKIFQQLAAAHPALAAAYAGSAEDAAWRMRLAGLPNAWAWRQAQAFLDAHLQPGREAQLQGRLTRVETRLRQVVVDLVCDRAAAHCLERMTLQHKQALAAYGSAIANAGQVTTGYGRRHMKNARSAMRDAQGAVPAWIMPLRQVTETLAPEPDSFDVVIVDEASQVGLDGLLLLWLAPRIIVVGDDRQCAPFYNQSKHERITQIFDERLAGLKDWQREGFDPKSNLYDLLSARFTEVVRLTEHFRCMPEIIKWSSTQFYPDNELVLLRQHGADRLPPLKTVHVPEGHCEGRRERLINRPEAEAVVDQLLRLTQDPAYASSTMGVIILRYGAQTQLVQNLIDTRIDPAARERHKITVGTAEQFQGDQRDVILLSMVIDGDNTRAVTSRDDQRRFNVAASRARNQMWLFHSVTPDQLSSKDLRHSLLTYMLNPPPPYPPSPPLGTVSPDHEQAPFQSLFEQKVFLHIKERGYHVVPQWEVNGKFIDLVVIGDHGRLAVECDGSPYHSSPEQIRHDTERERELRRAGWTFWRIRSSAFALSPQEALTGLWEQLEVLGIQPMPSVTDPHTAGPAAAWTPVDLPDDDGDDEEDEDDLADEEAGTGEDNNSDE